MSFLFFRYAAPRARSDRTKWAVVMSEFAPICICSLLLFLLFYSLYALFRFVFQPDRDLIARPPFFFVVLTNLKLEWVVWEIKLFRFIVRALLTAIRACPDKKGIRARLKGYRRCVLSLGRLYCLMRKQDNERK